MAAKVFLSYSHRNSRWRDRLVEQLNVLAGEGLIEVWTDRDIAAGADWLPAIEQAIAETRVAIVLVSPAFFASEFISTKEVPVLLQRRKDEGMQIVPIIVEPCQWQNVAWLAGIQARPLDNKSLKQLRSGEAEAQLAQIAGEVLRLLRGEAAPARPNEYEIDLYQVAITVKPALPSQPLECKHGPRTTVVQTDNVGCIEYTVTFAPENRRKEPFDIYYRTRTGLCLHAVNSHANEAIPDRIADYEDRGLASTFTFTPRPGEIYRSVIDVYGGFGEGQRDVHFHFGTTNHARRRVYVLRLSDYVAAGYAISQPILYRHPHDPGDCGLCEARRLGNQEAPKTADASGVWTWEFADVRQGVVDIVWDVRPPSPTAA